MKGLYGWWNRILDVEVVEDYGFFTQSKGYTQTGLPFTLNRYADSDSCHLMLKYNDSEIIPVKDNKAEVVFPKNRDMHTTLSYIIQAGDRKLGSGFNDVGRASHLVAKAFQFMLGYENCDIIARGSCCSVTAYTMQYELKFIMDFGKETCKVVFSSYRPAGNGAIEDGVYVTYPLNTRIDIVELVERLEKDFYGEVLQYRG